MRLKALTLTDEGEELETITFVMSLNELAAIHAVFGCLNGRAHKRLGLTDADDVYGGACSALSRFYESGTPLSGAVNLPTINDPLEKP